MKLSGFVLGAAAGVATLPLAHAWGAAGHEIVATIAQIHLHPSVREKLCHILPAQARCHLAPVAAWADTVRYHYPGTGPMHYVNAKDDHPADHCDFGGHGWVDEDVNVLTAIMNKTHAIMNGEGDIPIRFLTHFVGDMHQPLHLAGRQKGGNGAMFLFEGRHRNLHSVWDSGIVTKNIRELSNYTSPVPSKQVEGALLGAIFDPYVRWIVWEGIRQWWRPELAEWISCPASGDPYPHSSNSAIPPSSSGLQKVFKSASSYVVGALPQPLSGFLSKTLQVAPEVHANFPTLLLQSTPEQLSAQQKTFAFPACPYTWAKELHRVNCDVAWPKEYTDDYHGPLIELDTDAYLGEIGRRKTVEKVLAMAGLRLAKILNEALGEGQQESLYFAY